MLEKLAILEGPDVAGVALYKDPVLPDDSLIRVPLMIAVALLDTPRLWDDLPVWDPKLESPGKVVYVPAERPLLPSAEELDDPLRIGDAGMLEPMILLEII